jgi:hypothetical protein
MVEERPFGQKVKENEDGTEEIVVQGTPYLTYDPSALDYMLINAVKDLDARSMSTDTVRIAQLEAALHDRDLRIERLERMMEQLLANQQKFDTDLQSCCFEHSDATGTSGVNQQSTIDNAKLEQNIPNPFRENTTIKYYLPSDSRTATITISDLNGVQLKQFDLVGSRGFGQVLISGGSFAAGTYVYTLIVNGKQVDSKKMMLL